MQVKPALRSSLERMLRRAANRSKLQRAAKSRRATIEVPTDTPHPTLNAKRLRNTQRTLPRLLIALRAIAEGRLAPPLAEQATLIQWHRFLLCLSSKRRTV
jgi:hypothetical protein